MRALVFSGIALIAGGGILLVVALRMRNPQYYSYVIPRPANPSGMDPLPDESWVLWEDSVATAAEIASVERTARRAAVLPSRYSRVVPTEPVPTLDPVPPATRAPAPPSSADLTLDFEAVATSGPELTATPSTGSPGERAAPATDAQPSFFEQTIRILREDRRRPRPPRPRD